MAFPLSLSLFLAGLLLTACGDVDNSSTRVSSDVRPVAPITAAQQNNNGSTGLPTDPTRSAAQAAGPTATAGAPTATAPDNAGGNGGSGQTSSGGTTTTQAAGGGTATTQAAAGTTQASTGGTSAGGGNVAAGLTAFKASGCSGCHLGLGKAAGGTGPKLSGTQRDDAYIKTIIRNGKGAMPAHSTDEVSDQQITDLIAYIRSLK